MIRKGLWTAVAMVGLAGSVLFMGCGKKSGTADAAEGGGSSMSGEGVTITGAGSTFIAPICNKWAYIYRKSTGMKMNYQSIGSGGGISQIEKKTVDFGASDAPLKEDDLNNQGLVQWPMIIGGVVPVVNLPGVKANEMKLTGELLAQIYLRNIKKWNDPKIQAENPGMSLPDQDINVVHRSDGSGTTWIFTSYLTKVSTDWRNGPGHGKSISWPAGEVGGKGNEGVATLAGRTQGSIGYVEYAYCLENHMASIMLKNRDGNYVKPTAENFQAAAAGADWANAPGYYLVLTDQPGAQSWPITGASFILVHTEQANKGHALRVLKFFDWCYRHGQAAAKKLKYVPIPESVVTLVEKTWSEKIHANGKQVWKQ